MQPNPLSKGYHWHRFLLGRELPDGKQIDVLDFGFLIGVTLEETKTPKELFDNIYFGQDSTHDIGHFELRFKAPVMVVDHDGDQFHDIVKNRLETNVHKIEVFFNIGHVPTRFTRANMVGAGMETGLDSTLNLFVMSQLILPDGSPLFNIQRLKQICYAHPLEVDVNDKSVLPKTLGERLDACVVYLNERMAQIQEPLDNLMGYTTLAGNNPLMQTEKGHKTRVFSRVFLPPQEIYLLSLLAEKQKSKSADFASFTKLVNHVLIERLLMERWDLSIRLYIAGEYQQMMQETTPFAPLSGEGTHGKTNTPYLPPTSPIFQIKWNTQ